jgi:hypothetical protein
MTIREYTRVRHERNPVNQRWHADRRGRALPAGERPRDLCLFVKETIMRPRMYWWVAAVILACGTAAVGDILELKNGTILDGKYAGGTATTVRFETGNGMQVIETSQIIALTFTVSASAKPQAQAAPAQTPTTPPPQGLTLPAGTVLLVRMMDSVSSKSAPGSKFAGILQLDLTVGDKVVAKAGTMVHGKVESATQAGRVAGKSTLNIELTDIVINGRAVPIVTSNYRQAGPESLRKVAGGAAGGAIVGGIFGSAGKGAAAGATAGALVKGQTVTIPPGAMLEFTLRAPVMLPAGG